MSKSAGRTALISAAMIVAAIRMWQQLRGQAKTPFNEWVIGWGALFFMLSLVSEVAPGGAGMFALIVALSDFLKNGVSLTTDISNVVTGAETSVPGPTGNNPFIVQPFAASTQDVNGRAAKVKAP